MGHFGISNQGSLFGNNNNNNQGSLFGGGGGGAFQFKANPQPTPQQVNSLFSPSDGFDTLFNKLMAEETKLGMYSQYTCPVTQKVFNSYDEFMTHLLEQGGLNFKNK